VSDPRKTLTDVNWKLTRADLQYFSSKVRPYWFYVLYLILAEPGTELLSWVQRPSLAQSWIERMLALCKKDL